VQKSKRENLFGLHELEMADLGCFLRRMTSIL
jgi:hypothetical protein